MLTNKEFPWKGTSRTHACEPGVGCKDTQVKKKLSECGQSAASGSSTHPSRVLHVGPIARLELVPISFYNPVSVTRSREVSVKSSPVFLFLLRPSFISYNGHVAIIRLTWHHVRLVEFLESVTATGLYLLPFHRWPITDVPFFLFIFSILTPKYPFCFFLIVFRFYGREMMSQI